MSSAESPRVPGTYIPKKLHQVMPANPESSLNWELRSIPDSLELTSGSAVPKRHMASTTTTTPRTPLHTQELRRREPLPSDALHPGLCTQETSNALSLTEVSRKIKHLLPALGPLGRCYLDGVGAGCCSEVHPYPPPHCPLSRGTGSPGPTPSPSAPRPGNWPSCSCLRPGALYTGPSHCAGEGGERTVSDAQSPSPTRSFRPPGPATLAERAPEPLRLNLVPHSSGTACEQAPQQKHPRRGSDAPEVRLVHGGEGDKLG